MKVSKIIVESARKMFKYKKLSLLLGFILTLWLYDYLHFLSVCFKYSQAATHLEFKLPSALDKEMIVVLTGDRKRIPVAIDLLKNRKNAHLLISGAGKGATLTELVNSQEGQGAKVRDVWGHIMVESKSGSTIENARESGKIIQKNSIQRVFLVTSEYHMLRSLLIFQSLSGGPEYIAYPAPSEFSAFLSGELSGVVSAFAKVTAEYWKYFVFRNYFLNHLYD